MRGVWVDGSRVLRNQAVVVDASVLQKASLYSEGLQAEVMANVVID